MIKRLHLIFSAVLALLVSFSTTATASADDLLLNENFSYPAGNLYGQAGWWKYASNPNDPIQVVEGGLTYAGYQTEAAGGHVRLLATASGEDLWTKFNGDAMVAEGSIYASFLMKVDEAPEGGNYAYFFSFIPETRAGLGDGKSGSEYGRVFVMLSSEGKYKVGVNRYTASKDAVWTETEYNIGETYLVVVKYEIVEGTTNDIVSLWVNPATSLSAEPAADVCYSGTSGGDASLSYGGICGVELRQGQTASAYAPVLDIDALRVGTAWADLFTKDGGSEVTTPVISASPKELKYEYYVLTGDSRTFTTTVTGTNLTGDITVTAGSGVVADKTTITAEEAAEGAELTLTVTATGDNESFSTSVTLSSEGVEDVTLPITFNNVLNPTPLINSMAVGANLAADPDADFTLYQYKGKAVVTHIEAVDDGYGTTIYNVYAQDMMGGILFSTEWIYPEDNTLKLPYQVGDELTGVLGYIRSVQGAPYMVVISLDPVNVYNFATVTATGKTKEPLELTEAVTATNAENYIYRLVKITDATFSDTDAKPTFTTGNHNATYGDGWNAVVRPAAGTDLVGTDVPAGTCSVVGISKSVAQLTITPRSLSDITVAPDVNITPEKLYEETIVETGKTTELMKYTVVAKNLPAPASIELTGGDEAFSVSHTEIPAGTSTTEVILSINPTTIGTHKGTIQFYFDDIDPSLNQMFSYSVKAYDPDNLPTVVLSQTEVSLEAKVGEKAETTVTLTPQNCFDYINAKAGEALNTGITISNTFFMYNAEQQFKVTFAPKVEGEFTQTFTFTTTKGEPVVLTVTAKATGEPEPEPVEGDEFVLDATSPLAVYEFGFDGVEHNKPLSVAGWTNVAETGTRAWWGYTGANDDEFTAAKATLYDSQIAAADASEASMLLVSPALDYKNAATKNLDFSVMGMYITEGQAEKLTVCLIEIVNGEPVVYALDDFGIPATEDEAGKWIPFTLDMSIIPDMPDVFFIGFRLSGSRSVAAAATYYIDSFSWGKGVPDGISAVRSDAAASPVYNMQGVRVLNAATPQSLRTLAPGVYITAGKKFVVK